MTASLATGIERVEVRSLGDAARMLDLPETASLFPVETVWLRRVLNLDERRGDPIVPRRRAVAG